MLQCGGEGSVGGIATFPGQDGPVRTPVRARLSVPYLLYNGYGLSFPGLKQPERDIDHASPSSAEVKEKSRVAPCFLC